MRHYYNPLWNLIAGIVSQPTVAQWLIKHAQRTPYTHIMSMDGSEAYMMRWWLFNPYRESGSAKQFGWGWLPSIRIHHILREDHDRHLHDHPWNARTMVLKGHYVELREDGLPYCRMTGDTAALRFGEYHRITCVSQGGVFTLFITWKYRGTWGFKVNGNKVPWREYLASENNNGLQKP